MLETIKKIISVILLSFTVFFMFVFFGGIEWDSILDDEVEVDEYGYTLEDDGLTMEQLIEYYGGQDAYIYDDVWYDTYLYLSVDDELHYYVDDEVSPEYLALLDDAIQVFNDLGYITITYEVVDVQLGEEGYPIDYNFAILQFDNFTEDMYDAIAYNAIDWLEDGDIYYSVIHLSWENYLLYDEQVTLAILIHEIAHTFGLNDLYDEDFTDDSLMYYADHPDAPLTFTEFDLYNLAFLYDEPVLE